ncbi:MAG: hypothetical protein OXC83_00880 [Chloroflexi bacterium]|nr:hypothetical protein [Chloroflexota bacterium]
MTAQLRELFPSLSDFSVTSPQDARYNCVAWAAGMDSGWWWPGLGFAWPFDQSEDESLLTFITAFNTLGFERCEDGTLEEGFEKIAVYQSRNGQVSHVARQLSSGRWTSKIGTLEDIEHSEPSELEGERYGSVTQFMRRGSSAVGYQMELA